MKVGLVFSSKDPMQKEARDSVIQFIDTYGLLVEYAESDQSVKSPTLIINGLALSEKRKLKRKAQVSMFPTSNDMLQFLEQNIYCL